MTTKKRKALIEEATAAWEASSRGEIILTPLADADFEERERRAVGRNEAMELEGAQPWVIRTLFEQRHSDLMQILHAEDDDDDVNHELSSDWINMVILEEWRPGITTEWWLTAVVLELTP